MTADTAPDDRDQLTRFLIEGAGVRGVRVHLHDTWQQIRGRAQYPPAAAGRLADRFTLPDRQRDTLVEGPPIPLPL